MSDKAAVTKSTDAFRTISEVSESLEIPQHVLRFWETKFTQVKPMKRAGGRRYYRPSDVSLLGAIRSLLYDEGYTIRGVQKLLREKGIQCLLGEEGKISDRANDKSSSMYDASKSVPNDIDSALIDNAKQRELDQIVEELCSLERLLRS